MSFKITGVIFILLCGLYFTIEVKKRYDKRITILEEFLKDFEFFINEISFLKTPVNEILSKLNKEIYDYVIDYYKFSSEEKLREGFSRFNFVLQKRDLEIILDFFKSLGTNDYENQINNLKAQTELLKGRIEDAKMSKEKNQKSKSALIMCSFILIIIFLV